MHQVSKVVDKNISVMSILDLEDIADNTVCCQTFDKVESGLHESTATLIAVLFQEIVVKVYLERLSNLISTVRVGNYLNYSSKQLVFSSSIANAFVWGHKEIKVTLFEDFLEKLDKLKGQDILTQVIINLENAGDDLDRLVCIFYRPLLLIKNHHLLL